MLLLDIIIRFIEKLIKEYLSKYHSMLQNVFGMYLNFTWYCTYFKFLFHQCVWFYYLDIIINYAKRILL